uniref:Trimethylguanosine synthase n=1 Tax=Rhodosorus marinus TaxID=101924 RepID=A0A7S2ZQP8_9RHOD|mmetsp:Transcript_27801/g.109091  ORF Transcript_27801/g.109091 Transcript_27801/m.109091 type:complete len:213 (+) Transcript_27801:394-1032(+)
MDLEKYYWQRYRLFSRYDEGVLLDDESWFSVTPEKIAEHIADRLSCDVVVDAFAGAGGNTIQFARTCKHVVAIENNEKRLQLAVHNASIYEVENSVEFILGDAFEMMHALAGIADAVFLSPPWGGPCYADEKLFDLSAMKPYSALFVVSRALELTPNVAILLPKTTTEKQILRFLKLNCGNAPDLCEVEYNYLGSRLKTITVYFGNLVRDTF